MKATIDGVGTVIEAKYFTTRHPGARSVLSEFEQRAAPRKHAGRPPISERPMPFAVVRERFHGRPGNRYLVVGTYARLGQAQTAAELTIVASYGKDRAWIVLAPNFSLRPVRDV